jgi:transposase
MKKLSNNRWMSPMEARKFRIIHEILEKRLSNKQAAEELELTCRQIIRLKHKVEASGPIGLVHGHVGKAGNRSFTQEFNQEILSLWQEKYMDLGFNYTHFTEKLGEIENIIVSKEKVRNLLNTNGFNSPYKHKSPKHRKKRERRLRFGELIQQDTSPHDWLGTGIIYHLISAVDDATSNALFIKLFACKISRFNSMFIPLIKMTMTMNIESN